MQCVQKQSSPSRIALRRPRAKRRESRQKGDPGEDHLKKKKKCAMARRNACDGFKVVRR